jgi:hypothetical protein
MRLVPAAVSPIALSAFCYHLADRKPLRIAICWLDGSWKYRLFGANKDAIRHLLGLLPLSKDRAEDFKTATRGMNELSPLTPLGHLARLWQSTSRPIPADEIGQVLSHELNGRYVIVQACEDDAMYFQDVGHGFPWLEERWVARSRGLRMQDQPDYHLGRWAAAAYREAARSNDGRLDDIDAITIAPHLGRARLRYTRLIVPIAAKCAGPCLLGAAEINTGIDLRPEHP